MIQQQQSNNTTVVVQNQPQPAAVTTMIPVVNDNMGLSIFACLCCCCPIGIFAIIKSCEVRNLYVAGDYAGAIASAESAKKLAGISIGIGMFFYVVSIIIHAI
ncbi:transmembrane protein 91-like [Xenia sp. Carnegie-2017]|uniref:transmembrane protein 91-like n=1 Tax=Xenia sp. Carnegie-2017 TaxID=2897299 RepID=UPI001F03D52D|nr:transmembrane protein 91-like [Xenia sp. Carnegie-2017]